MVLYALEATTQDELTHFKLTKEYKSMQNNQRRNPFSFMSINAMVDSLNKSRIMLEKMESGLIIELINYMFDTLVEKEDKGQLNKDEIITIVEIGLNLFLKIQKN